MYCVYIAPIWWKEIVFKMFNHIFLLNVVYIDKGSDNTYVILKRVILVTQNTEKAVPFTACTNMGYSQK